MCGLVFEHADFAHPIRAGIAAICACGHGVQPGFGAAYALLHVHQFVAYDLMLIDGHAKGLALLRPGLRLVVAGLRKTQRAAGNAQPLAIEVVHDGAKALALRPQKMACWHTHAVKEQLRSIGTLPAHFVQAAASQTSAVARNQNQRQA